METVLKVTPEKLMETAGQFSAAEANIKSLTDEMISVVESFKPIWQGEAATAFANRFAALSDDMNRLYMMIRKHSEDLIQIANEYSQAEAESGNMAASLVTEAVI